MQRHDLAAMQQQQRPRGENGRDGLPADVTGFAIFLDIDGTLLDIANTPDGVVVPPDLVTSLAKLADLVDGALALVTGRPIETVDRLFAGFRFAAAGLHGAEWRNGDGGIVRPVLTAQFLAAKDRLRREAARLPGVVFEDKGAAIAAHYRLAPAQQDAVLRLMQEIAVNVEDGWTLQQGKQVVELRPTGRDKGDALTAFMGSKGFAGRRPLAVGDDLTDEAMFAAANRLGGLSVRVGEKSQTSLAHGHVASPALVRDWVARVVA